MTAPASRGTPAGSHRRLFFALVADTAQRAALAEAVQASVIAVGGRHVPRENLHVTLAFLGQVPEARIDALRAQADAVAASQPREPLHFGFDGLVHWRGPAILCAQVRPLGAQAHGYTQLLGLAQALREATSAAGFTPDLKPFRPHVTVARKVPPASLESLQAAVGLADLSWHCDRFVLLQSTGGAAGALYSAVDSWVLDERKKVHE